eukprot:m.364358 g.364358  ORF g.364358 m.364358 type:complete len:68 (+) comp26734_c0_seq1:596-799(+)
MSVFIKKKDDAGTDVVYHSYSTFAAGMGDLSLVHTLLDRLPSGRDEKGPGKHNMWWVKHKEQYPSNS